MPPRGSDRVILLLGFQPFGGGEVNCSWEAVRGLEGETLAGCRIAARQLPVVWGAPLTEIQRHVDELKPSVVFAFGQGLPGAFKFERKARNLRGPGPDNRGQSRPGSETLPGGPAAYVSRYRIGGLREALGAGFPLEVSEDAGNYLCEEALYSVEHACRARGIDGAFFHLPPLESPLEVDGATRICDNELLRGFVRSVVSSWAAGTGARAGG